MAKSMAVVNNGVVTNIIWCTDNTPQTATWLNCDDRPVAIGDTYSGGKFYRDGVEILTPLEEAQKQIAEYEAALSEIETALGVNT
nr:MAG TPA: pepsin inhibitor [Caudoviricetes sp.]